MPVEKSLFTPKPTSVPATVSTPEPVAPPTSTPTPTTAASPAFAWLLVGVMGFGGIGYLAYERGWIGGERAPAVVDSDGFAAGKSFAPILDDSLAQGFEAFAAKLDAGAKVEDANATLKQTFTDARTKAFAEKASHGFDAIVPSGTEPKDDAARKAFSAYSREFAKGLRGTGK